MSLLQARLFGEMQQVCGTFTDEDDGGRLPPGHVEERPHHLLALPDKLGGQRGRSHVQERLGPGFNKSTNKFFNIGKQEQTKFDDLPREFSKDRHSSEGLSNCFAFHKDCQKALKN